VCDVQVLVAFVLSFVVTRLSETILFSAKPHYTLAQAAAHVAIGGACLMAVLITLYAPFTLHLVFFVILVLVTLTHQWPFHPCADDQVPHRATIPAGHAIRVAHQERRHHRHRHQHRRRHQHQHHDHGHQESAVTSPHTKTK
jgi:hypothetical protein